VCCGGCDVVIVDIVYIRLGYCMGKSLNMLDLDREGDMGS
jgi:hypothetical protein